MKKKIYKSSVNNESSNSFINNSFFKPNNFTNNTYKFNVPPTSERNEILNSGKKILNQQEINNWQKNKIKIKLLSSIKKHVKVNSSLLSISYVKPLKFAFKNHIESLNTLETERNGRTDRTDSKIMNQKNYFQPIVKNNYYKCNFTTMKSNDKKEKFTQNSSTNSLIMNITHKKTRKTSSVKDSKNKKSNDKKNKKSKNNSIKYNNTDRKNKNIKQNANLYKAYAGNQKEKIQANHKGHLLRNNFLNISYSYEKYKKLFEAIKNLKFYKKAFWSNLIRINGNNKICINKDNNESKSKTKDNNIKYIICQQIDDFNYLGNSNNSNNIKKEDEDNNNNNHNHNLKDKETNYIIVHIDNFNYRSNIDNRNKNKIFIISNAENINYNSIINDIKENNSKANEEFEKEKKEYEEKIKILNEENKKLNEKLKEIQQENEKICENFKKEIDNLSKVNTENIKEKEEILKELKLTKENYEKILKSSANDNNDNKKPEINIIDKEKEKENILNFNDDEIYEDIESKKTINEKKTEEGNPIENNENNLNKSTNDIKEGELNNNENQKGKDKKVRFKEDNDNDNEQENEIDKIKKEEEEKKKKEKEDLKRRLRRSRSLRRMLISKAKEKKELLRSAFLRFYEAGLSYKIRSGARRRTVQFNGPVSTNIIQKLLNEKKGKIIEEQKKEEEEKKSKEELDNKRKQLLEKIVSVADRKNKIALNNSFQKFYLKVKLDSVQNILKNDKKKKKKKKKTKKKAEGKNEKNAENKENENENENDHNDEQKK